MRMLWFLVLLSFTAVAQQPPAASLDTLFLSTGTSVPCRVLETTESAVKIEYRSPTDGKMQTREVPWTDILRIDFAMDDEFHALVTSPSALLPMLARWEKVKGLLSRRSHPAGDLGLAIARTALSSPDQAHRQQALDICGQVELNDWNTDRRDQARWVRVQLLAGLGLAKDAITEARVIANDELVAPTVAMQANLFIGRSEFQSLKKLEEENPLWLEDDLVRPERDQLFHAALDHFLKPSLFQGSLEAPATEGLWGALQLFVFDQDVSSAAERARDLIKLYPASGAAKQAQAFLSSNNLPLEPVNEEPPELQSKDPAKSATPEEREPAVKRRERYTRQKAITKP